MDPRRIREEAKKQAERVAAAQAKAEEEKQRRAEEELFLSEGGRSRTYAYYCSGHGPSKLSSKCATSRKESR